MECRDSAGMTCGAEVVKMEIKKEDCLQDETTMQLTHEPGLISELVPVLQKIKKETISEVNGEDLLSSQSPRLTMEGHCPDASGICTSLTELGLKSSKEVEVTSNLITNSLDTSSDKNVNRDSPQTQNIRQPNSVLHDTSNNVASPSELIIHMRDNDYRVLYKCGICGKRFKNYSKIKNHTVVHSDARPYKCEICEKSFKREYDVKMHYRSHSDARPFKCDMCGNGFKGLGALNTHVKIHAVVKQYKCDICQKSFSLRDTLVRHIKSHSAIKQYKCHICEKSFTHEKHIKQHMNCHSGITPYKCGICERTFSTKPSLINHKLRHGKKRFQCEKCGKSFYHKTQLQRHIMFHSDTKHYICDSCGKSFKSKSNLEQHVISHSSTGQFKCDSCGIYFKWKSNLKQHLLSLKHKTEGI